MDSMTDKTNNKNLEEREKRVVQHAKKKRAIQNPNTWDMGRVGAWCVNIEKAWDIGDPLEHFQQHLIHTHTKVLRQNPLFVSAPSLASSQNQPLRCHSTFKAAWPTSQVLAPTGKYELSRCSLFFFFPPFGILNLHLYVHIHFRFSSGSDNWQRNAQLNLFFAFSKYSKKMQTHHRSGECRPIFSVRRNCAYTSSLYIVRWVHIEFLFFLSSFLIEPYLIFEEMFVQLCLAKLQAKKKTKKAKSNLMS